LYIKLNLSTLIEPDANFHTLFSALRVSVFYCIRILSEELGEGVSDFAGYDAGGSGPSAGGSDFYGGPM